MGESHTASFTYADYSEAPPVDKQYSYIKNCYKGVVGPAHPLYSWLTRIFEEKGISFGELLELTRQNENCYLASRHPKGIILWDVAHELVPVSGFRRGAEFALIWTPSNIVSNSGHAEIIHPDVDYHIRGNYLHFPQLYTRQNSRVIMASSPDCRCISTYAQVTSPAIISAVCMKNEFLDPMDWNYPVDPSFSKLFSLSRVYSNLNSGGYEKRYSLLCPQPLPLAVRWTHRITLPAYHGRSLKMGDRWYLGLADRKYRQETSVWFQSEPAHWTADCHPFLSEPLESSELAALAASGYGCETIPRLHFGGLGAAHSFWISCSDVKDDLTAEVFEMADCHSHESFLLSKRENFLAGKGKISCPSCAPILSSQGRFIVSRFTRRGFIAHYRDFHKPDAAFLGVEAGTGLNQRLMEAFCLYLFSLAREAICPDSDMNLRGFDMDSVAPYTRGAEACTPRKREASSFFEGSRMSSFASGSGSTPASSGFTPAPSAPMRAEPNPSNPAPVLQAKQPAIPLELMEIASSVAGSPDPSGLNSLSLGAEAPGAEVVPLPRRETSRSRKVPGDKPEKS